MPAPLERAFVGTPGAAGRLGLQPVPFQFLFTGEDQLRVTLTANVPGGYTASLVSRFLLEGGSAPTSNVETIGPVNQLSITRFVPMPRGVLLNLAVRTNSLVIQRGQLYAQVDVQRGDGASGTVLGTLVAGYVRAVSGRAWPGSPLEGPDEGPGYVHAIAGNVPAAGADPVLPLPGPAVYRLIALDGVLTTNAVVAARTPLLTISVDGVTVFRASSSFDQPAGTVRGHTFSAGASHAPGTGVVMGLGHLPVDLRLNQSSGSVVPTLTTNGLQAGDQWAGLNLLVEEWRAPA
jgi:hypothetical protein